MTNDDLVLGLLRMDDDWFELVHESYLQFGTNYVGGVIAAVAAVRRAEKRREGDQ